jgi:hypothetical protein
MKLITIFLGCQNVDVIVATYDKQFMLPLLIETTKLLMLTMLKKLKTCNFEGIEDLFQTISTNVDTYKDLMSRKLIGFRWYLINVENCKCYLSWSCKEQNKFSTLVILAIHIFGILEHIFSMASILTTFPRCRP